MSPSLVPQLVLKDVRLMARYVLWWWLGGLVSVALMVFASFMLGMVLFVTCLAAAGIHAAVQTVVEERRDGAHVLVLSLPITVREYTRAKLLANLVLFVPVWLTLSAASTIVFYGPDGMPHGAFPFVLIVLVGIFLACTVVLWASFVTGTIGGGIAAIVLSNLVTQLYLRWVAALEGIRTVIGGDTVVWTTTAVAVLGCQLLAAAVLLSAIWTTSARKTELV